MIETIVIKDKEAYLMTDLLEDIASLSNESGLQEASIKYMYELKSKLQDVFGEQIAFYNAARICKSIQRQ